MRDGSTTCDELTTRPIRPNGGMPHCGVRRVLVVALVLLLAAGALTVADPRAVGPVLLVSVGLCAVAVVLVGRVVDVRKNLAERRARDAAVWGSGRVLALRDSGRTFNDSALLEATLLVTLPGRTPYTAGALTTGDGCVSVGDITPVRVSSTDPQRIWLERAVGV